MLPFDLGGVPLVLASQSPRRREILDLLHIPYTIHAAEVDENPEAGETPRRYVTRVAIAKARAAANAVRGSVILAADTTVTVDGLILGKPVDRNDACQMLRRLAGRDHEVLTAVAVVHQPGDRNLDAVETTRVWFSPMDEATINGYVEHESVLDKAGAYAIQGFASVFIPRIEGNYLNVVGLPLPLVCSLLRQVTPGGSRSG